MSHMCGPVCVFYGGRGWDRGGGPMLDGLLERDRWTARDDLNDRGIDGFYDDEEMAR